MVNEAIKYIDNVLMTDIDLDSKSIWLTKYSSKLLKLF